MNDHIFHIYFCPICNSSFMENAYNEEKNLCNRCISELLIEKPIKKSKKTVNVYNGEITWSDHSSGLMWELKPQNLLYAKYNFKNAQIYIETLNKQKYTRYRDWRLPSIEEYKTLYFKRKPPLYLIQEFDQDKQIYIQKIAQRTPDMMAEILAPSINDNLPEYSIYWTSNKYAQEEQYAIKLDENQFVSIHHRNFAMVRCVRDLKDATFKK